MFDGGVLIISVVCVIFPPIFLFRHTWQYTTSQRFSLQKSQKLNSCMQLFHSLHSKAGHQFFLLHPHIKCYFPGLINHSKKIPLAPMGVLAPGSSQARPSAWPPIDTSGNFSAHMSGGGEIVWQFFWSTFSPNQRILSTCSFFQKTP